MEPERWRQIEKLYHAVLDRPADERAAFLAQACDGNQALQREVESLLAYDDRGGHFISSPPNELAAEILNSDASTSLIGKNINQYRILSLLGRGGMGDVYLAQDSRLGRKAAVKLLPPEFTRNPERIRRFEQEARAISALNHPNIITIYEIGQVDSQHFIAGEYVEGKTLRALISRGGMGVDQAIAIAEQIANALGVAHGAGIIHRDIKPENVMLRADGLVKVLDFGLAKLTGSNAPPADSQADTLAKMSTDTGVVLGTVSYMSPEQARGQKVDHRTDIFSLGVLLYEMIAGSRPFDRATRSDEMAAILMSEPPPLASRHPETPPELERIITKALRKDRAERYQSAKEMLLDLKNLKTESNSAVTSATVNQRTIRKRGLGGRLPATAIGLILLLAAVAGLWIRYFRRESKLTEWRAVPLTSYRGFERNPSLSPDGNQVAFSWNGEKQENFDIYVRLIGSNSQLRLTTNPADDVSPAWSPDGRTIAFLRHLDRDHNELMLIPALGGPERKLTETLVVDYIDTRLQSLAWTPDGHWLAVSHRESGDIAEGLFLVSTQTGEKRRLTTPPPNFNGDGAPAFSPDGRLLAVSRLRGYSGAVAIYILPLSKNYEPAGEARQLKTDERFVRNPIWTHDGHSVLYLCAAEIGSREQTELRMIPVADSGRSVRVARLEGNISEVHLGRHLVYTRHSDDPNIWRAETAPPKGQTSQPRLFISSTRIDNQPRYSPDGKKIAFSSSRSGASEIWISDADGSHAVQLTSFGGPLVGFKDWSPDSQRLVFHARPEGQADIFTIPAVGGTPQRLTTDPADDAVPSYSRDGRSIYFASLRSGQSEVWKMPAEGGNAVQITFGGGRMSFESPDGRTLYFIHLSRENGVWKMPVEGGEAVQVTGPLNDVFNFAVGKDGIFYSAAPDSRHQGAIQFLSFSTGKMRPVVWTDHPLGAGLSLSPDQRFLLFSLREQTNSDLMMIENFVVR